MVVHVIKGELPFFSLGVCSGSVVPSGSSVLRWCAKTTFELYFPLV